MAFNKILDRRGVRDIINYYILYFILLTSLLSKLKNAHNYVNPR